MKVKALEFASEEIYCYGVIFCFGSYIFPGYSIWGISCSLLRHAKIASLHMNLDGFWQTGCPSQASLLSLAPSGLSLT